MLSSLKASVGYLGMGGGQAFADVDPKQGVLAQGDVELEELGLFEVEQGPPEHSGRHFLGHPPSHFQVACVDAAVPQRPRPCGKQREQRGCWDKVPMVQFFLT